MIAELAELAELEADTSGGDLLLEALRERASHYARSASPNASPPRR